MDPVERISEALELNEEKRNSLQTLMGFVMLQCKDVEEHLKLLKSSFSESFTELQSREMLLKSAQESGRKSFQEFDSRRKWIEEMLKKVEGKENLAIGILQEMEKKEKQFGSTVDEKLREICLKEQQVEGLIREMSIIQNEMEIRANELDLKEKKLDELENELGVREKILELTVELNHQKRELVTIQKSQKQGAKEPDSVNQVYSAEVRPECRKRCRDSLVVEPRKKNDVDAQGSDMGEKCSNRSKRTCVDEKDAEQVKALDDVGELYSDSAENSDSGSSYRPSSSEEIDNIHINLNDSESDSDLKEINGVSNSFDGADSLFVNIQKKDRLENMFEAGQTWACFDGKDSLPRSYATIAKVLKTNWNLRMQITWLKPVPWSRCEKKWINAGLPVGCGLFKRGMRKTLYPNAFSHQVSCMKLEKCMRKSKPYFIRPRKGETWAIYKDWDIAIWSSHPENQRKWEYEIVEILSYEVDLWGIRVACLEKLQGHMSSFQRSKNESVLIRPNSYFRFSHRVPSAQMTCNERVSVPDGVFELDPKCLPPGV
ncbi:uncharacterized protein [Coffea arabica]|uniref:DUF3444 domain-containing protein n=1 Tax=Coffea arabica TaxID=13443 RepID=A0A6P6VY62_COFAR|nr:uncharacterized protein LOC113727525 [Coffea arabica]